MSSFRFQQSMRAGLLGTVRMGKSLDALVKPGTKVLDVKTAGSTRYTDYDVDGDGRADVMGIETLGADGKVTTRSLDVFDSKSATSFIAYDSNNDGKIDGFSRQSQTEYDYFGDGNHDGKTDDQSVTHVHGGKSTSAHSYLDVDHDGKADLYSSGSKAKKGTQAPAALSLPAVGAVLGKSVDDVLRGAAQVSSGSGNGYQSASFDLDGDGKADVTESDWLDPASGKVTSRTFTLAGTPGASFGDNNADGVIDSAAVNLADGTVHSQYDGNGDAKPDADYRWASGGVSTDLFDENQDGLIDWISVSQKI